MKRLTCLTFGVLLAWMLASCGTPAAAPSTSAPTPVPPTATVRATTGAPNAEMTQAPVPFPLSEPGPYYAGKRTFAFQDASRDNRRIGITVWYPAVLPEGSTGTNLQVGTDRDPDLSGAPYPLILSSTKVARQFAPYLVTHGFAWASVDNIDVYIPWNTQLVDQPLDILYTLDQVASNPPKGLEGMIDAEHAGAIGYSFDGYNALALSGVRIDPDFYLAQCAKTPLKQHWIQFGYCNMSSEWDQFAAHAGDAITTSDDGLWQPMTSERIRAVMPMAPEGAALFGERGLSAVDRPTLIIGATEDVDCDYEHEAVYIFGHLGTPDKALISFVGRGHMMVGDPEMVARMAHFAAAFFGYHLQGREDLAYYFSEDFVALHDDLAWGVYEGE